MIPKWFELLGQTFEVRVVPEHEWTDDNAIGLYLPQQCAILIRDTTSPQVRQQVFCHELFHLLFDKLGKEDLFKDEAMIDLLGSMLHQVWTTIDLPKPTRSKHGRS